MKRAVVVATVFAGMLTAQPAPGAAPADVLVEADPGPGSVVTEAPSTLRLRFAEPLTEAPSIRLFDSDANLIELGDPGIEADLVEVAVPALEPGRYLLDWEVNGEMAGPGTGSFIFVVDPTGRGTLLIDRRTDTAGTAETWARLAAAMGAVAGLSMVIAALGKGLGGGAPSNKGIAVGVALVMVGSAVSVALTAIDVTGSAGTALSARGLGAVLGDNGARLWLVVALVTLAAPYLAGQLRTSPEVSQSLRWRIPAGLVVAIGVVAAIPATARALGITSFISALGVAVALGASLLWAARRQVMATGLATALVAATIVVAGPSADGRSGVSARAESGAMVVLVDLLPGRHGVNEMHVYGLEAAGYEGALEVISISAQATHLPTGAGPLEIALFPAGPNHYLTYAAELPLAGRWRIDLEVESQDGERIETAIEVDAA